MDAILGRYRVRVNDTGLVLTHLAGISFDITANEALAFLDFLDSHQQTLIATQPEANPQAESVFNEQAARSEGQKSGHSCSSAQRSACVLLRSVLKSSTKMWRWSRKLFKCTPGRRCTSTSLASSTLRHPLR
jgi:hypothetical protein